MASSRRLQNSVPIKIIISQCVVRCFIGSLEGFFFVKHSIEPLGCIKPDFQRCERGGDDIWVR